MMTAMAKISNPSTRQTTAPRRQPARAVKMSAKVEPPNPPQETVKQEPHSPEPVTKTQRKRAPSNSPPTPVKEPKIKDQPSPALKLSTIKKATTAAGLQARKLRLYTQHQHQSPFPAFPHPTPEECHLAHRILVSIHGARTRPAQTIASATVAGCGASPSVLDALVRTILSQNTSSANSSRAYRTLVQTFGTCTAGTTQTPNWAAIMSTGAPALEAAIRSGGLARVKSRVIVSILEQVHARYRVYSLDHLHDEQSADAVMAELLSFKGVGPKTASCVLLFCLGRESFAVDTHVWRISGLLGWRPAGATRDETHLHLDVRIPDEYKYGLHVLMVAHGKSCVECKAGGRAHGRCPLRKAFAELMVEAAVDDSDVAKGEEQSD